MLLRYLKKIFYNSVAELRKNTIATEACTSMKMVIDYNITPKEYLSYAKLDLDEQYGHHLINALCNAKRAFHCQLDIILKNLARKTANSFLSKKKLLEELGIITPRILEKLNRQRNILEHEYTKPSLEEVSDFLDITELFIEYTNKYVYTLKCNCSFENVTMEIPSLDISYRTEDGGIEILYIDDTKQIKRPIIDAKDINRKEILRLYLNFAYEDYWDWE